MTQVMSVKCQSQNMFLFLQKILVGGNLHSVTWLRTALSSDNPRGISFSFSVKQIDE